MINNQTFRLQLIKQVKGPLSPEKKVSLLILFSMVLVPETETAVFTGTGY